MFKVNNKDTRMTSSVSIVNFEHVIVGWAEYCFAKRHNRYFDKKFIGSTSFFVFKFWNYQDF